MLFRTLALSLLVLGPAYAAAQQLPDTYSQCRDADAPEAGIAACTEALKSPDLLEAERARVLLRLAIYNRMAGEYPAALDALAKAAAIAPRASAIPAERAVILYLSGNLSGAMEAHAKAFALEPGSLMMFNNRGVTELALGDVDAAIADFDSALSIMGDSHAVLANRAMARCRAGDVDGSVADRLASIESDEGREAALHAAMATAGFRAGTDAAEATDVLEEWTKAGCPGEPAPEFQ